MKRRTLLAGVSTLPFAAFAGRAAGQDIDQAFAKTCSTLAGTSAFPGFFAAAARGVLEAKFGTNRVTALVQAVAAWSGDVPLPADVEDVAQYLLVILYTGEMATSGQRGDSPYYPWALAWQTLAYTNAPGVCGAGFGSWTRA
jgi:hypothetical protein